MIVLVVISFAIVSVIFLHARRITADTGTGSISLTTLGSAVTENFDTLSNTAGSTTNTTLPTGWYITEQGGGARDNEQYAVDTGSSTTGDIYSYGAAASTDRALGALRSGTLIPFFGAKFTNNTGATITSLAVAYTGEEWRLGTAARTDRIDFQISTNATDLTTGTYTDVDQLDFTTPDTVTVGAKNGNAAGDRTAISFTIPSLSIANGATFFIRWIDFDASGADDGLSVDEFSLTPNAGAVTPTLNIGDVTQAEGDAGTSTFSFLVSLTAPAGAGGVSFTVNTADGTTNPANAGSDYVAIVNGSGSIMQGNSSTTVSVTVNGDTTPEPNETFFVNISNITGANAGDVQGLGTINNDDVTLTAIHTIQGSGTASPLAGQSVTTRGIVTGIKLGTSGGFFIQEPDATVDADPNTSEGVFVFTAGTIPAGAVVGNLVQVTGTVQEFVFSSDPNSPPITEISGSPTTTQLSTGNPLPVPITLTVANTTAPSGTTNPLDTLEEFEGMRVTVPSMTVVAPTDGTINEPNATVSGNDVFYGVVTGVPRPFREPGVNISDPLPPGSPANVPRFDENPERIRVDSDGQPGTTPVDVAAGTIITNVTGPLDYSFRTYTILPDVTLIPGAQPGSTPVPVPTANELTVASFNMERFFDTVNDPSTSDPVLTQAAFDKRLDKASRIIRTIQRLPDVIGVEEMENLSTLQAVAMKINNDVVAGGGSNPGYVAYLVEGNDVGGIDVGFLVKESRVTTVSVTQFNGAETYVNPNTGSIETLNDRPPLVLRATVGTFAFTVIVNHLRSLSGVDDDITPNGSGTEGSRVRAKRKAQAESLANLIQSFQTANPAERIITVGDMNAFRFNDGFVDVIGTVMGTPSPDDQTVVPGDGVDLVNPNQTDLVDMLTPDQRYSFTFDGNAQVLDHIILNPNALALLSRFAYARDDADFPVKNYELANELRISDHDQPIAYFTIPAVCMITCPPNVTKSNDSNQCGALVTYAAPTTTGPCGTVTCSPASGSFFPVGTTTVTCTSSAGPTCSFNVTVNDTQAPTITCPANVSKSTDPNQCQATVNYPTPTVSDNCPCGAPSKTSEKSTDVACVPTCSPASGSMFPKGVTTVTCNVSDVAGNPASCSFTVTVQDMQPPSITCPANVTKNTDPTKCFTTATYPAPTVSDNCSGVGTPTCSPASGSTFQKGTTTVTCMVSDASSNQSTCMFTVTVNDNEAPSVTCPANIVKNTDPDKCTAVATYSASANDNCPGVGVACSPASGTMFPKGTTTVTCTATDASGNTTICRFTVQVNDTQPPVITCPAGVTTVTPTPGATSAVITYPAPVVTDNCGATTSCNPPSGSTFPTGCTVVSCTATDASGNTALCFFNVCVFNICLQDDSSPNNRIVFNTTTGDYRFCCSGMTFVGKGKVTAQGSTYTLEHNIMDRRVLARASATSGGSGTASLQSPPGKLRCNITDSNSSNNTTCSTCL